MNKLFYFTLTVLVLLSGCKNTPVAKGEECSVKLPGIEFTKSLNNASSLVSIESGRLILKANAKSDNFNDPDGKLSNNTAPVLLARLDNSKPFTFISKVTPTFNDVYDAGTMYIYMNQNKWFKFAFERDERMLTRAVTVRTIETSDDNNHDVIDSASMYMKISSDTKTIGFYYSIDKKTWQLVRLFRNDYPAEAWIGVSTQAPVGNGTSAVFEDFSLTQNSIKDFRMGI
ncbi:DUF1349 domain-containing protein [Segetibacter sp. 3557_3]|uniref:DUF1349 domain-containing protein n=1 Tax=Segetibacter sp. 3557_3 TaxID=2547429 RepID=UPI0010586FE0|nr:DUF1349 domain-containing protein [Segetibacter sp. 3557_3]TDH28558.1 DUF1349 domain-containing protein [Segetibacter sp. 3557_3]